MNTSTKLSASRVNAIGRAYERLAYTADYEKIELIEYLREVIKDLEPTVAPCTIQFEAPQAIQFAADRAILVGLIITGVAGPTKSLGIGEPPRRMVPSRAPNRPQPTFNYPQFLRRSRRPTRYR